MVYGMPRSVVEAGLSDASVPLDRSVGGDHGARMKAKVLDRRRFGADAPQRCGRFSRPPAAKSSKPRTGSSALEHYFLDKPDVVLLDLVMKGMYGWRSCRSCASSTPSARVVVVSADIQTSSHELVEEAGATAFINKPFDKAEILSALETALAGARSVDLTAVQQDALDRTDQHRLRPRRRGAVEADRAPRAARSAAGHDVSDRRNGRAAAADVDNEVASVHQIFSGPVDGDALLVLDQQSAAILRSC